MPSVVSYVTSSFSLSREHNSLTVQLLPLPAVGSINGLDCFGIMEYH